MEKEKSTHNLIHKLGQFCFSNLENGNFELILKSLGQRYLFLISKKEFKTNEFISLYNFFKQCNLIPSLNKEGNLSFIVNKEENVNDKNTFFKKRNEANVVKNKEDLNIILRERSLIEDIFWDFEEEIKNLINFNKN